jgi:hypothetical protein
MGEPSPIFDEAARGEEIASSQFVEEEPVAFSTQHVFLIGKCDLSSESAIGYWLLAIGYFPARD